MDRNFRYYKHQAKANPPGQTPAVFLCLGCPDHRENGEAQFFDHFTNKHSDIIQRFRADGLTEKELREQVKSQYASIDPKSRPPRRQAPRKAPASQVLANDTSEPSIADPGCSPEVLEQESAPGTRLKKRELPDLVSSPRHGKTQRPEEKAYRQSFSNAQSSKPHQIRQPPVAVSSHSSRRRPRKQTSTHQRTIVPDHAGPIGSSSNPPEQKVQGEKSPASLPISARDRDPDLLLQPDSRPISQEQLASEVKSIYSALIMVENKCMHVDRTQAATIQKAQSQGPVRLPDEHWQALTALHRTLLHEHHDFFLASQHPSASEQLRRLAAKYSMPARMWKHGIHSYLELLRHQLPESLEYMLSFIYLAYQMMALLLETVPSFEDTWIECLGDLGRYRMAIEDEDPRDREIWAGVARFWYTKAANKSPVTGRLYHHLAILARPNALQQMYLYSRSLNCVVPFYSARDSVMTLLEPVLGRASPAYPQLPAVDVCFLKLQSVLLEKKPLTASYWEKSLEDYRESLTAHIDRPDGKFRDKGTYTAITNLAAICEFGSEDSGLRCLYQCHAKRRSIEKYGVPKVVEAEIPGKPPAPTLKDYERSLKQLSLSPPRKDQVLVLDWARHLTFSVFSIALRRSHNEGVFSYVYILLSFLVSLTRIQAEYDEFITIYVSPLFTKVDWERLCRFINTLLARSKYLDVRKIWSVGFLQERSGGEDILPEDLLIRGQIWAQSLFSDTWFDDFASDDERVVEPASTGLLRAERIIHAALDLASFAKWIQFDFENRTFSLVQESLVSITPMEVTCVESSSPRDLSCSGTIIAMSHNLAAPGVESAVAAAEEEESINAVAPRKNPHLDIRPSDAPNTPSASQTPQNANLLGVSEYRRTSSEESFVVDNGLVKVGTDLCLMSYTIIIWDIIPLIKELDVFWELVTKTEYQVVVPESVISQLTSMSELENPANAQASAALQKVRLAVAIGRRIQIIGIDGLDVTTSLGVETEVPVLRIDDETDLKDLTIGVARQQSDLDRQMQNLEIATGGGGATAAILVTSESDNDINTRAQNEGVHTAPVTRIKSLIKAGFGRAMRPRSLSQSRYNTTNQYPPLIQ